MNFQPGDLIEIQDARGEWHQATAKSAVEGTHDPVTRRKVHDFPIVWIEAIGNNGRPFKAPWPRESIRPR